MIHLVVSFININQSSLFLCVSFSVIHLHERWLKDCTFYRDIYEQIDDVSLMPRIDWGPVLNQKQVSISNTVGTL